MKHPRARSLPVIDCDSCRTFFDGSDPEAAIAAGWFSMARKGGDRDWRCPEHAPKGKAASGAGLHTGMLMGKREPTR